MSEPMSTNEAEQFDSGLSDREAASVMAAASNEAERGAGALARETLKALESQPLTETEKELREWMRLQVNGDHWWLVVKGGFRRSVYQAVEAILAAGYLSPEQAAAQIAAAEQRGREDNADHGMCYVAGSEALAARERQAGAAVLREVLGRYSIDPDVAALIAEDWGL